jgi:hydrophobic/amphiphilic exporter-1 (mainly G- bacteria), HAE1 family
MSQIQGIRDTEITLDESKPELKMKIKKEEAARLGLTPYEISRQTQTFTIGTVSTKMMLDAQECDIRVRLDEKDRNTIDALKKLVIVSPTGAKVYLSEVVEFEKSFGAIKITRENQVRKVSVTANFFGRDFGGLAKEILEKTKPLSDGFPKWFPWLLTPPRALKCAPRWRFH